MFDVNNVRKDFPMINNLEGIYFDSSATSLKPQCVIDAINDYYTNKSTNIHRGEYDLSFEVSNAYDQTRKTVKDFINAQSDKEIVFTSGATESLNMVMFGYLAHHLTSDDVILTSEVEHASNILPIFEVARANDATVEYIPLNKDGTFNLRSYEKCFQDNVKFVCLTAVSNVLGYKYPIKEITRIAHKYGAIVCIDGAQAVPHSKIDVSDLDIDFLSFSGHKMCGPTGVGVLYGKYDLLEEMIPLKWGGGANARFTSDGNVILKHAPEKHEAGTPNISGVLGLKRAIEYLNDLNIEELESYEEELAHYFIEKISEYKNIKVLNKKTDVCIVSFNVDGIFAQDVASYLNKYGICVRSGNHCAKLIGNVVGANECVRASLYFYNTKEEIDRFIDVIKDITLEKCIEAVL